MKINHHCTHNYEPVLENTLRRIDKKLQRGFPGIYKGTDLQKAAFLDAELHHKAFNEMYMCNKDKEDALPYLERAHQFIKAHFLLTMQHGKSFKFTIYDTKLIAEGIKTQSLMNINRNWFPAFYLAIVLRDHHFLINTLLQYDPRYFTNTGVEPKNHDAPFFDVLKGVFDSSVNLKAAVQNYVDATTPEKIAEVYQPHLYRVQMPFVECLIAIVANDEAAYHKAFMKAHQLQIEHLSSGEYGNKWGTWLSRTLLIAAVLAHDSCGFKMPMSTPYVPDWMAYGDFEQKDWQKY